MANNREFVKSKLTVFIDVSAGWASASQKPIGIAQSYTLDESGETREVVDLGDADSLWANPEINKQSWTLSVDSLVLRPATGTVATYDASGKVEATNIKIGDMVWVSVADNKLGVIDNSVGTGFPFRYGKGVITAKSQAGTVNDIHTVSLTISGKGALLYGAMV
jgi:hypothetical protein